MTTTYKTLIPYRNKLVRSDSLPTKPNISGKAKAYQSVDPTELHYNGKLLSLPENIRLAWKWLTCELVIKRNKLRP
jgi:hypothetical protein